jgi:hypothetical protein
MAETISIRMGLPSRKGRTAEQYSNPAITANSVVLISASEANIVVLPRPQENNTNTGDGEPVGNGGVFVGGRFLGAADVSIRNVSPQDGIVHFVLFVDWGSPLDIAVDIVVFDPPGFNLVGV